MNKVLIIVGEATETVDTLYPFFRVQEDGFIPVVAGPEKRRYHMVLHEIPPDWDGQVTREFEGYTIQADIAFKDVKPEEYVGIFFSGGPTFRDHGKYMGVWMKMLRQARDASAKK